jgi:hypothetical protein
LHDRTDDTRMWIVAFLVVAVVMIATGVGWLAFGPEIR